MLNIRRARAEDRREIEQLIFAYHSSESLKPVPKRIALAVDELLRAENPGLLLVAELGKELVGVALAVTEKSAELGRVLDLNDFYVIPTHRRKRVGTALARKLVELARRSSIDEINLEVIAGNRVAAQFWKSLGFEVADRSIYRCRLK